jgi:hypothetical protein
MNEEPEYEIRVTTHKMLDTGIGQEMGYANDDEFREAMRKKREALPPEVREAVEEFDREVMRKLLGL